MCAMVFLPASVCLLTSSGTTAHTRTGSRLVCRNYSILPSFIRRRRQKTFNNYPPVQLETVSAKLTVPDNILKPHYALTGQGSKEKRSIPIHTPEEIDKIRVACRLGRKVLNHAETLVKVGVSTDEIDRQLHEMIVCHKAYPSPLNYQGFPKGVCTSVNNVACHGIPDSRKLQDGDIVNVDVSVYVDGYHGDLSETFLVGKVDAAGKRIVSVARACLDLGVSVCGPGVAFSAIGNAIEPFANENGYTICKSFVGHGIGAEFHTAPDVLHHAHMGREKMQPGMVFTIEPILCEGRGEITICEDGWTAMTVDGGRSAQFEHTIAVLRDGIEVLTAR